MESVRQKVRVIARRYKWYPYVIYRRIYDVVGRKDETNIRLNIGGGVFFVRGWKNLDYTQNDYDDRPGAVIDYQYDLTSDEPFPINDGTVSFAYSSHVLEHLHEIFIPHVLSETYRVLKDGGVFRIAVPDFEIAWRSYHDCTIRRVMPEYAENTPEEMLLHFFCRHLIGRVSPYSVKADAHSMERDAFADRYSGMISVNEAKTRPSFHCNYFTHERLRHLLQETGFRRVIHSTAFGSSYQEFQKPGRNTGFDGTYPHFSLYLDAVK